VINFNELIEKQSELSSKIDKSLEKSDQSYEKLSDNVSRLDVLSGQFKSYNESIIEFYNAIGKQNEASQEIAETLEGVVNSVNGQTQEMSNALVGITSDLVNSQESMGSLVKTLGKMSSSVQNLVEDLNEAYAQTVKEQMKSFNQSIEMLGKQNQELTERSEKILKSFELSAQGIEHGGGQIIDAIKALNLDTIGKSIKVMSDTLKGLEGSMQATSSTMSDTIHKFDEDFAEKIRYTFKVLDEEIGKILSKVGSATKALKDTSENIEDNLDNYNEELLERLDQILSVAESKKDN
jgi:methyl-accepting chemotaxis protein